MVHTDIFMFEYMYCTDFGPYTKQHFGTRIAFIFRTALSKSTTRITLKVPKREIFDRSDFPDFYSMKSSWVGDSLVQILSSGFIQYTGNSI